MSFRMGIATSAMGGIEGYKRIRTASLGISFEGGVIGGRGWTYAGHVMGVVGGLVSIWDGMNKLTESAEAAKTGQSLSAHHALILGGFGVVSGIFSIIMIGASTGIGLVVSVFFGVLALLLGWYFVTMVSPAVQMWVNRSILGYASTQADMQILPFEDLTSEQSSLEMVFQGVVIKLWWKPVLPNTTGFIKSRDEIDTEGLSEEIERVRGLVELNLEVIIPQLPVFDFMLELRPHTDALVSILNWKYYKDGDASSVVSDANRPAGLSESLVIQPDFILKDDCFELAWSKVYGKDELTHQADLTIQFRSHQEGRFINDVLSLQIEAE